MLRILTLGRLDIRRDDGHSLANILSQKKRVALLCYLAAREPRAFVQRHAVAAMFWPDSTEDRARNALRNALHYLRTTLHPDLILTHGDEEIALDPNIIWCDVAHFESLVKAGRLDEALTLYNGEFLDGFLPGDLPDFNDWVDRRRRTITHLAIDAARQLAFDQSEEHPREALQWTRKWTELAPYEEPAMRAHVQMLMRNGDRAGAIEAYELWEARLAKDLAAAPSKESARLIESIRAAATPKQKPPATEWAEPPQQRSKRWYLVAVASLVIALGAIALLRRYGPMNPAVQAYNEGEKAYDAGRYDVAVDAFQRALARDSTFAKAHLALSFAANWTNKAGLERTSVDKAMRYQAKLSRGDRILLHAWQASVARPLNPVRADSLFELLTHEEPKKFEAWYQLGEVRYHWGPTFGYTADDASAAFTRALDLMPHNTGALLHLLRIDARRAPAETVEKLARRMDAAGARTQEHLEAAVLVAAAANDRAAFERNTRAYWTAAGTFMNLPILATNAYRPAWFTEETRRILLKELEPGNRLTLRIALAQLLVQQGAVREAIDDARSLTTFSKPRSAELVASILAMPFVTGFNSEIPAARAALQAYLHDSRISGQARDIGADGIFYPRALLLDGLLALKIGRADIATGRAVALDTLTSSDPQKPAFAKQFARVLKARIALESLSPLNPLTLLGSPAVEADGTYSDVLSFPKSLERWTRAEVYERTGRRNEALKWYGTFPDPAGNDLAWVAAAHAKRNDVAAVNRLRALSQ